MKFISGIVLLTCLSLLTIQANAQIKVGLKVGGNVCNMKFDIDRDYATEPETKAKMGYHVGLISDITLIEEKLSLQPALLLNNKGYSVDMEEMLEDEFDDQGIYVDIDDFEGYLRMNYNYIEVPINLVYKYGGLQVFAGPYVAFGIWGNMKMDFSFEANNVDFDNEDFFDEDSYKLQPVWGTADDDVVEDYLDDDDVAELFRAFDCGLNLGIGYQVNKVLFNVGYSFGFVNMTPKYDADEFDVDEDYTENVSQKNRVFSFSMSVFFN